MDYKKLSYKKARKVFSKLNGKVRIPDELMRVIVDYENKNSDSQPLGMRIEDLKNIKKKDLKEIKSRGYEIYEFKNLSSYINYENLRDGDLLAVKFNGITYETENIIECINKRNSTINCHPPYHFSQRYKKINL